MRADAGCPQQCEEAELRQTTDSGNTAETSLRSAAVERQEPEWIAQPGMPQACECATTRYSLAQFGAGAGPIVTAGVRLVQRSADPEFGQELEHLRFPTGA